MPGLLVAAASLAVDGGLQGAPASVAEAPGLSSLCSQAPQSRLTDLAALRRVGSSRAGLKPLSPAWAGGCSTTGPPGKPDDLLSWNYKTR